MTFSECAPRRRTSVSAGESLEEQDEIERLIVSRSSVRHASSRARRRNPR